ncbi:MAG TPA: hydrogenase subunit MbhD domain-containing protein [Ignavibacteriaceae bacterium]|jgi:energy-converting hydrogenase B subunit D|nr:hydrogenase subunit MbhD domain-containing protein [Ignavibacteriaceae bacterium]
MHWEIELVLYCFLIAASIIALYVKDLLTAVVTLSVYSFIAAILLISMGAIDVGFTEAVVGAGISGVLYVVLIFKTSRRSQD